MSAVSARSFKTQVGDGGRRRKCTATIAAVALGTKYSNKSCLVVLATSRRHHSGNGDSDQPHVHQRLSSTGGAGLQASLLQNGCKGPGLKKQPDVGLSRAPYEVKRNRADDGIEQGWNERELRWSKRERELRYGLLIDERATNWFKSLFDPLANCSSFKQTLHLVRAGTCRQWGNENKAKLKSWVRRKGFVWNKKNNVKLE